MHIVTVENFLFCFRLETGGYFLGWLGLISSLIGVISIALVDAYAVFYYDDITGLITDEMIKVDETLKMVKTLLESQICE